jgi:putative transposase
MFFRNDIFMLGDRPYRVLNTRPELDRAWVINLDDLLAWPLEIRYSDISECPQARSESARSFREPSKARKERRDAAVERITPLVERVPDIYDSNVRGRLVVERARELRCSVRTLHKDLRRFWQGGQVADALLADFHRSGRKLKGVTASRGHPPTGAHTVYQLTSADLANFKECVEQHYLKDSRISMAAGFQRMLEKHYTFNDGNAQVFIRSVGSRPTIRQFRHFLHSNYSQEVRIRGREGDKDFERDHRAKLGTVGDDCRGVGHYYEIDATIADVYLVSSESVDKIIGKPTLYLIIDRKSRLVVGFYAGLENASWIGAMQAMLSISIDKRELCKRYGVRYDPEDWPAHEVFPQQFLADRGEMISTASRQVCDGLESTVSNAPGQRPDWKPLVECGFKLMHETIRDVTPAYDPPSNATRRRGKHYEKDACLTLSAFGKLILEAILSHNRKAMRDYDLSLAEIAADLFPTPIAIWNHDIKNRAGILSRHTESHVRHALLPKDVAVVTEAGISFKGCYYTCADAVTKGWFVSARKRRFKVDVSYDSRLVDSIFVQSGSADSQPCLATLTSRSNKYQGLSFAEVRYYERLVAATGPLIEDSRAQTMLRFHQEALSVIESSKKLLRDEGTRKSRSARRADIVHDRASELRKERQELVKMSAGPSGEETQNASVIPIKADTSQPQEINEGLKPTVLLDGEMTAAQRAQEMRRKMLNGD